jgi:hypothetical protein
VTRPESGHKVPGVKKKSEQATRTRAFHLSPPIDEWERQGALRELTRVARDLEFDDSDAVIARLGRLTQSQREAVAEAMERILELGG